MTRLDATGVPHDDRCGVHLGAENPYGCERMPA